jgi:hypothetical protein
MGAAGPVTARRLAGLIDCRDRKLEGYRGDVMLTWNAGKPGVFLWMAC